LTRRTHRPRPGNPRAPPFHAGPIEMRKTTSRTQVTQAETPSSGVRCFAQTVFRGDLRPSGLRRSFCGSV